MTAKLAIPIVLGVTGVSAATATTISAGVFSPKKCWYDGEKDGSFLEEVEKVLQENPNEKIKSEIKDLIKSLCTTAPGISLLEFEQKFGLDDYKNVFELLSQKWSLIKQKENQKKD